MFRKWSLIVMLLGAFAFLTAATQIQSEASHTTALHMEGGSVGGTQNDPDWALSGGNGVRQWKRTIVFAKPFKKAPTVTVAIGKIDMHPGTGVRLRAYPASVALNSFELVVETWADSHMAGADATWLAVGSE